MRESVESIDDLNRLNGIYCGFQLICLGSEKGIDVLKNFDVYINKITAENIKKVRSIYIQEKTRVEIEQSELRKIKNSGAKSDIYEQIVYAENVLKRSIDKEKLTVAEWIFIEKSVNNIIKPRKK